MTHDDQRPDTARAGVEHRGLEIPRWVKVFALIALVIALALLAHMIIGGGSHGPALHGFSVLDHVGVDLAGRRVETS
ncbi:hypothetical protein PHK61_30140 [Actinomycetospora lutea]|uniref:hypothetical protein n=1 Tax=Actinomycetospora lutea TaxID=663604 RepID=UPI002365AA33|nr:hypothetical protein [Actinomycetospora lutea]MDD7942682.1 hypothetical protein [Actinomycetospora lutea]